MRNPVESPTDALNVDAVAQLKEANQELVQKVQQYEKENEALIRRARDLERELLVANSRLDHIQKGRMYQLGVKAHQCRELLLPRDSLRYRMVKKGMRLAGRGVRLIRLQLGRNNREDRQKTLHAYGRYPRMDVITTRHTLFIAEMMKRLLEKVQIACEIHIGEPAAYLDIPYIIICPQFVNKFPKVYFAMQMEQTVSSRWFTADYVQILEQSCGVLDYAMANIAFFQAPKYHGISSGLYYLPIDYCADYAPSLAENEKTYDVIFYGDTNNERRKTMLDALSKRFRVKILSDCFGEDLYREISKAKVLVNIHYYEGALLETTRLYEALSLNSCMIVSEDSENCEELERLRGAVDFIPTGDLDALIARVDYWVNHNSEREEQVKAVERMLRTRENAFSFFFYRFLLAHDRISFDTFYKLAGNYVQLEGNRLCLSLPESVERRRSFEKDQHNGFQCFPGLKHETGWVGCGLSYKFIFHKAREAGMKEIMICEDDVIFPEHFEEQLDRILSYLHEQSVWNVFSGVMADVGKVSVLGCNRMDQAYFLQINRMVSTVFNIYHHSLFDDLCDWDESQREHEVNAIDRYLQRKELNVFVQLPFLVGHKEELQSTVWNFSNVRYADMISQAEKKLLDLAQKDAPPQ